MPYTQAQLARILNVEGHAFLAPDELPHLALRVGESYTRRRVFHIEDTTVIDIYRLLQVAFSDWRQMAEDEAEARGLEQLAMDKRGRGWMQAVMMAAQQRFSTMMADVSKRAFDGAVAATLMNYYGRAWMLDMGTGADVPVTMQRLDPTSASRLVLDERAPGLIRHTAQPMREVKDIADSLIYQTLGLDWRADFANELDDVIVGLRRTIRQSLLNGDDIRGTMRAVSKRLGVVMDRRRTTIPDVRGNFNKIETMVRSYVINRSNVASLVLYEQNADVVDGVIFLPANDGRVCPLCEGYREQRWPLGSPDIVQPVVDTHLNCRCSLIPDVVSDLAWPADEPPRDTFREWALQFSLGFLFGLGLSGPIDSVRI